MAFLSRQHSSALPSLDVDTLRKRSRILVIDDQIIDFPAEILRAEHYNIQTRTDVGPISELENGDWDIIVLDIGGVGRSLDPKNEGAAVLAHIKRANPRQVVVAYSGQSHDPARIQFFSVADEWMPKSATVLEWKEMLDRLLQTKLSPDSYLKALDSVLQAKGIGYSKRQRIKDLALRVHSTPDWREKLTALTQKIDDAGAVVSVITKLAKLVTGVGV